MSDRRTRTRRALLRLTATLAAAALILTLAPATAQAGRGITLDIWMGDSCLKGRVNDNAWAKVVWKDDLGAMKARGSRRANARGYWRFCGDDMERVEKGDTIKVVSGGKTKLRTVPNLKLVADRVDDTVNGMALPNTTVKLTACKRYNFHSVNCYDRSTATNESGRFSYDFTPVADLIGRDFVLFSVKVGADKFTRHADVPFIWVHRGKARFWGFFKPFKKFAVKLYRSGSMIDDWTGRADDWDWGYFSGRFADEGSDGDTYRVRTGDRIVIPKFGADADWTVPDVKVNSVYTRSDVINASCGAPGLRYEVYVRNAPGTKSAWRIGKADSSGRLRVDMTSKMDIKVGHIIFVNCQLKTGDVVARKYVIR
jgi:hypothetical protein